MKIQSARIAMKLDTDVAETLCVSTTMMILKSSSVLLAYGDVFTCGAKLASHLKLARNGQIGQNWPDF